MAQIGSVLGGAFDATQVAPSAGSFNDPLPKGWVLASIDESSLDDNSAKTGKILNLRFSVFDGPYKGRKVFDGLNIVNASERAQQIARADLSSICHAIGRLNIVDSQELHGVPMWIKLTIEEGQTKPDGSGKYPDRNRITAYKNKDNFNPPANEIIGANEVAAPTTAPAGFGFGAPAAPAAAPAFPAAPAAAPAVPAAPVPPAAPPAPPAAPVQTPAERLTAAGWTAHPQAAGYWYKGQDVKQEAEALATLEAPAVPPAPPAPPAAPAAPVMPAAPAAPAAPATPAAPAADPAAVAQAMTPPWMQQ